MAHKLFGLFSGTQLTILGVVAILTPSALIAVPTYQNVAVLDSGTGSQALVDKSRRLYVYDPIAGFGNNPANIVNIENVANSNTKTTIYTVPTGRALIVNSIGYTVYQNTSGNAAYGYLYRNTSPPVDGFETLQSFDSFNHELGSGVVFSSGETVQFLLQGTGYSTIFLRGYLVPSSAVPAAASAEAASQYVSFGDPAKQRIRR